MTRQFLAHGYTVYAAVRDPRKAAALAELADVEIIQLDVASDESIKSAAKELSTRLPNGKLDILVNNAGLGLTDALMEVDISAMRKLYDVNLFGLLAVTQACFPFLMKARGTVVNIGSVGGIIPVAFNGTLL